MTRRMSGRTTSVAAAVSMMATAGIIAPSSAHAATSATGAQFNNLSISSTLNSNPDSSTDVDDSAVVNNGDRLYLGSSSDPSKLSGWLTESDGSRKAFTPSDYTLTSAGDHAYKLSFKGTSLTINISQSANVATMYIRTHTGSLKDDLVDNVEAKKGNTDDNGNMALVNPDGSMVYNGSLDEMKGHGNATWTYEKKPYQIKLGKNTELVPGAGKAKTWMLLANYVDPTNLRNEVSYNLEGAVLQRAGATDTSIKGRLVDLNIDGDYRGTYYLTEKVQVDKSRVNITDTDKANEDANQGVDLDTASTNKVTNDSRFPGIKEAQYVNFPNPAADYQNSGYLLEMDFAVRSRPERSYFITRQGTSFTLQTPESANAPEMTYISGVFQDFEDALYAKDGKNAKGKSWQDYIDVDSWARYYALEEFYGNQDAFQSSTYFYLDKGGKIMASPIWDDDRGLGGVTTGASANSGIWVAKASRTEPQWIKQLQSKSEFRSAVANAYSNQVAPAIDDEVTNQLPKLTAEAKYTTIMNRLRWPGAPKKTGSYFDGTPEKDDARLQNYMTARNTALRSDLTSSGYLKSAALPDGVYSIVNGKLVADVKAGSTADKANAQLFNSNGSQAQRFRITRGDDGFYTVVNVKSGKALEVAAANTAEGANVQQYTANGSRAQKWLISSYDGTHYTLATALDYPPIAGASWGQRWVARVLTATGNGTTAGTNLEVDKDAGLAGQQFDFTTTAPPSTNGSTGTTTPSNGPQIGKTYTISSALNRGKVLDVKGASSANGANIQLFTANGSKAQKFTLTAGPNGTYILKTGLGGVMNVANAGTKPGTNVQQDAANGAKSQQWILKPTGANDGSYYIVSSLNGLNLDVHSASATDGTNVQVFTPNGTAAQKFYLNLQ